MEGLSTLLIIPLIVTVLGGAAVLIIEYFFVQPIRRVIDAEIPQSSISRDWATAMRKAIRRYRSQYYGVIGQWLSRKHETIVIDEWEIKRGHAILTLAVVKKMEIFKRRETSIYQAPILHTIAKHKLTIDRTGDILEIRSVPVDQSQTGYSTRKSQRSLPETTLTLKSRKMPRVEKIDNGVNVIIEFEVENEGKAGKVCPYIEFQVVTTKLDGEYTPKKWNTKPKPVEIPALCVKPFIYTLFFQSPDLPLIEPPHEVKIELQSC